VPADHSELGRWRPLPGKAGDDQIEEPYAEAEVLLNARTEWRLAMRKSSTVLAALAASALVAWPVLAQVVVTELRDAEDDDLIVQPYNLTVDQLEDMDIFGAGDEQIGEIEDVLIDASGNAVALVIETEGFLGIGDEDVVVGFDQVELLGDRFVTGLSEDQLEEMPEWED
jgi:sporulation protein YlmC with PRC-barrel domain